VALKNTQYDTIMRQYYRQQLTNKREQDVRVSAAYEEISALSELDQQISSMSVAVAKKLLAGDTLALSVLKDDIAALTIRRTNLLNAKGYPADYLEMRYLCPDCNDSGFIGNKKCHCFKQAVIDLLYTQSNIREVLAEENFDTFSYDYYSNSIIDPLTGLSSLATTKKIVAECRDFITHFDKNFENLFFYGDTGVGKTFLTHCIAKDLLESAHSVIYFSAFELFELFSKNAFGRNEDGNQLQQMNVYIFDCDLLIIDDLGTELTNSFVSSQLFLCINERLMRKKSTIISTNLSIEFFQNTYSERVFSRISSNYQMRKLIGDDIRIQKKLSRTKP